MSGNPAPDPNASFYGGASTPKNTNTVTVPYKGYTSSQLPATVTTSTPVVSSGTATDFINNKVVPTMNNAQQQITTSQQAAKDKVAADAALAAKKTVTPQAPLTPEQQMLNQPDAGFQFVYDKATGERSQVPVGSALPSNSTSLDVKNAPAADTVTSADGNITFKKLSDGTYGKYDTTSGQYVGMSNQTQFDIMKTGQAAKTAYDSAITNGALLNANQVAQIQGIKDTYARLLDQQAKDNANSTGGATVAQNLYGIGNTAMGTGAIKGVIDAGAAKIADLNSRMNSDVAKMTAAFQSENTADLKDAYQSFVANSSSLQKAIDTQHAEAVQLERDQRQQRETVINQIDNDIRSTLAEGAKGNATPQQMQAANEAAANHDMSGVVKALGSSLLNASGVVGEYNAYTRDAQSRGITPMSFDDYQTQDANRKIRIAAAGTAAGYSPATLTKIQTIANNFDTLPVVKEYQVMKEARDTIDNIPNNTQNPADQQNLIYAFAKTMDPNSVVREGEYATVQKYAQSMADSFGFSLKRMASNSPFLTQTAMENMKKTINARVAVTEKNYNNVYKESSRKINKISGGNDGSDFITDYSSGFKTVGDEHIQNAASQRDSLKSFISSSTNNAALVNAARAKYPTATPEQIYQKLKDNRVIQ